jgi:hypothetical protein
LIKDKRTFLVVTIDFVGADASVFGFSSSVDTLLFIDLHVLVALEDERFIVTTAFSSIQLQHGGRSETTYFNRVPLAVIDGDGRQPQIFFFRSQAVQIEAESQSAVFDLNDNGKINEYQATGEKFTPNDILPEFRIRGRVDQKLGTILRVPLSF